MEIKIKYDPYALAAEVYNKEGDSWVQNTGDWVKQLQGCTLRAWFGTRENWPGFCEKLFKTFNGEEHITIHFEGREVDYQDLKAACALYQEQGPEKGMEVIPPKTFLQDKDVLKKLKKLRDEFSKSPLCKTEQLQKALKDYDQCFKEDEFEIAVVAPTSSGKSTLINALLRQDFLPWGTGAVTNIITRVHDCDKSKTYTFEGRDRAENILTKKMTATKDALIAQNSNENIFYVDLYGDIPGISGKDMALKLIDTPGPNANNRPDLKEKTYNIVNDAERQPIILFVVTATDYTNDAQAELLDSISDAMKDKRQFDERFIFVFNYADAISNTTVTQSVAKFKEFVGEHGIKAPTVIPVSAGAAFYQVLNDLQCITDVDKFQLQAYRLLLAEPKRDVVGAADLSPTVRRCVEDARDKAVQAGDEDTLTMINSGIYGLELTINEYLDKYAIPYKVRHYVGQVKTQLEDLLEKTKLKGLVDADKDKLEDTKKKIEELKPKIDVLRERGDGLKDKSGKISAEKTQKLTERKVKELSAVVNDMSQRLPEDDEIEFNEAEDLIDAFNQALSKKTKELKKEIIDVLEDQLENDFGPLLTDSGRILEEFKDDLRKIEGFDPEKLAELKDVKKLIDGQSIFKGRKQIDADSLSSNKAITRRIPNPAKEGFFGKLKFWAPRMIEVKSSIEVIRRDKIMAKINTIADQIMDAKDKMTAAIQSSYKTQKAMFDDLISALNDATDKTQKDLDALLKQETELTEEIERRKEALSKWLNKDLAAYT